MSRDGYENRSADDWQKELKEGLADDASMLGYLTNDRVERELVEISIEFSDARHFLKGRDSGYPSDLAMARLQRSTIDGLVPENRSNSTRPW